jgi:hypothetical protein
MADQLAGWHDFNAEKRDTYTQVMDSPGGSRTVVVPRQQENSLWAWSMFSETRPKTPITFSGGGASSPLSAVQSLCH